MVPAEARGEPAPLWQLGAGSLGGGHPPVPTSPLCVPALFLRDARAGLGPRHPVQPRPDHPRLWRPYVK